MFFKPVDDLGSGSIENKLARLQRELKSDERMIKHHPEIDLGYFAKATTLMKLYHLTTNVDYINAALDCYNQAIKLNPENLTYILDRAICHINRNDKDSAHGDLNKASALPEESGVMGSWARNTKRDIQAYLEQSPSISLSMP